MQSFTNTLLILHLKLYTGILSLLQYQRQNPKSIECHRISIIIHKKHACIYVSNMLRDLPTLMAKHMLEDNYGSLWCSTLFDFALVYCKKWWNPCTMVILIIYERSNLKPKPVTTLLIYFWISNWWVSLVRIKFPFIKQKCFVMSLRFKSQLYNLATQFSCAWIHSIAGG